MKFFKVSNFLVAVSIFLSVGIFVTEASSPDSASASPAGSASGSVSNGYNFCLGVNRANAVVNVRCITRTTWTSVKSTRTTGFNLQIKGMCLTTPALKDGQDLFVSACGASAATQQDWVGLPNGGIGLVGSNFCLDVEVGIPKDGSPIQIYACQALVNGTTRIPAQRWEYDQAMFNQSQANAPVTTIAYQPPGRALPPTQQVTTTVYVGPPARGTATVPAITAPVNTGPPAPTIATTPQTTINSTSQSKATGSALAAASAEPKCTRRRFRPDDCSQRDAFRITQAKNKILTANATELALMLRSSFGFALKPQHHYLLDRTLTNLSNDTCRTQIAALYWAEIVKQKKEQRIAEYPAQQFVTYIDVLDFVWEGFTIGRNLNSAIKPTADYMSEEFIAFVSQSLNNRFKTISAYYKQIDPFGQLSHLSSLIKVAQELGKSLNRTTATYAWLMGPIPCS
jgi:hypothetical protein